MGASYSTTYVKETVENFMNSQAHDGTFKLVKRHEPHLSKTTGYTKLKMYLKKYVDAIEFVHKNPERFPEKITEIMDIRMNIQGLIVHYKVSPSFSYRTKYIDIEDQVDKRMNNFGRKRRSSKKRRSSFGRKRRSSKRRRVLKK
jgi:hypothetical protein